MAKVISLDEARKVSIDVTDREPDEVTNEVVNALERANVPPKLFLQKGLPVRVEQDEDGQPVMRVLKVPHMRQAMSEACAFYKRHSKKSRLAVWPTRELVENVLVTPELPFPGLRGIIAAPFFNAQGTMNLQRGYDPGSRLYLAVENGLAIPPVPAKPTATQREAAVALLDDLFIEFPFKDTAGRAHAFAITLLPFVREMITGPTPLHLVGAPTAGTGKTLLAQAALYPACGKVAASPFGKTDEEQRKLITTLVVSGCPSVLLDNLEGLVSSTPLCAALTSDLWKDRMLGTNTEVKLPNRAAWVATSNNARLSRDITRRTISIRLDAETEKPAERTIARMEPLLDYAQNKRGDLIAACLTIVQSWVAAGKEPGAVKMGSFESWARVIGGILTHAGIAGFLANAQELADAADDETAAMRAFVQQWEREHSEPVNATALLRLAVDAGLVDSEAKSPVSALGRLLSRNVDAVYGGYKITKASRVAGIQHWKLAAVGGTSSSTETEVPPEVPPEIESVCPVCHEEILLVSGACGTCGTLFDDIHHTRTRAENVALKKAHKPLKAPQVPPDSPPPRVSYRDDDDQEPSPEIPF